MLTLKSIGSVNGRDVYYLSSDEKIQKRNKIHSVLLNRDTEELFCFDTNVEGIYSFGLKQLTDGRHHSAGYVWSSRPGVVNGQFDMQLVEVNIDWSACWAMDINKLKVLVEDFTGKSYEIKKDYPFYDKAKEEPRYKLVEKNI